MTMMKKAVVSACIVLMLISACIGPAAAAINIWGADSTDRNSQTNDPAYNQRVAADSVQWYYDSENHVLWTEGGSNLVLPVFMNVTDLTNVWGYNLTLEGKDSSDGALAINAQKGAYPAAYELKNAKISASVSQGVNETPITNIKAENIVNASFDAINVGSYSIELTNAKLATSTNAVSSLADLKGDATIENENKVIAFKVMTKPFVDYFTIANDEKRKNLTTADGHLYFYYERDHADSGTLLTANITNMDTTEKFDWKLDSFTSAGALILELAGKNANADNFTTVNLSGTKAVGAYNNSVANVTIKRTGESHIVNVNATYWNQSASVVNDKTVTGTNITFTYNVAAVPQAYVAGTGGDGWDTYVQLYPVGDAKYQNYTIYTTGQTDDYTVINGTGPAGSEDKGVKNLTITKSTKTGSDGPIEIPLKSGINGDPNEDSIVDIIDGAGVGIETIRVASSSTSILKTAQQQFLADVDKNGRVDVADVLAIHAYIVDQ